MYWLITKHRKEGLALCASVQRWVPSSSRTLRPKGKHSNVNNNLNPNRPCCLLRKKAAEIINSGLQRLLTQFIPKRPRIVDRSAQGNGTLALPLQFQEGCIPPQEVAVKSNLTWNVCVCVRVSFFWVQVFVSLPLCTRKKKYFLTSGHCIWLNRLQAKLWTKFPPH